ncbi:MAG: hypothetical protein ACI8S6_003595 [Myxococcota bacterium]|jgi:hypothetical protein
MGLTMLVLLMCWVPVVITAHEAGHAVVARPAGFKLTSFGVGAGRPLIRHRGRSGAVFYVGRWFWAGGACVAVPRGLDANPREALYHAGGVLAQLVLAAGLSLLPGGWWWVEPVAHFNLLVLAWNAIPWQLGGARSDGWRFVASLSRGRLLSAPIFASRSALRRLLRFEETVGSPVGVWYCRLLLAWSDLLVGRQPDLLATETDPVSVLEPALDALQQHIVASGRLAQERPEEALALLAQVRAAHGSSLPMASSDLLTLTEARAQLHRGERGAAQAALARLAGVGGRFGDEARAIALEIALDAGDLVAVRAAAERLSIRGVLDPPSAAAALWRAGEALGAAGAPLQERAQAEASRLLMLAEEDDEGPLARRLGGAAGWLAELHTPGPKLG